MNPDADKAPRRLVIGCGTGRCGTVSLVKFLNSQRGISMLHEGVPGSEQQTHHLIPWYDGEAQLWAWLATLEETSGAARWYGDVCFSFLPYLPAIFKRHPAARAICLERDRQQVVRSYLRKTEGRNHWFQHDGNGWMVDPEWDQCYPDYAEPDKRKALELYWDQYHCTAKEYCARFPRQFLLLPTTALNEASGRSKLLEFIGYDVEAAVERQFRANASQQGRLRRAAGRLSSILAAGRRS